MEIEIAKYSGYCYGVERAFKIVKVASSKRNGSIFTLGPIIHNRQAVDRLMKDQGVGSVESLGEADHGTIVIRTHGVPPQVIDQAKRKGLNVVDATCPFVKKAQSYAKKLVKDGYTLVIIGEKDHPEVISIQAHAGGSAEIIESEEEAGSISGDLEKLGIVIQTTQDAEKVARIIGLLSIKAKTIKIFNTICDATFYRQSAARDLARRADMMLVVGGRHSGNTRRLFDICKETGAVTHHIETANEIKKSWFRNVRKLGITAGASTPDFILKEVIQMVRSVDKKKGAKRVGYKCK
jgi:4-hydroxy-3-methylbut-2-enyl diphosphate reductase